MRERAMFARRAETSLGEEAGFVPRTSHGLLAALATCSIGGWSVERGGGPHIVKSSELLVVATVHHGVE